MARSTASAEVRAAALESAVAALHLDVQQIRLGRRLTEGERE